MANHLSENKKVRTVGSFPVKEYPILVNIQLYFEGSLNPAHILLRKNVDSAKEPCFADSSQLVRHSLSFLSFKDYCLAGAKPVRLGGERNNLNSIKEPVRCIVADDYGWPLLFDFPTDGRIKADPPYLTPSHGLCL